MRGENEEGIRAAIYIYNDDQQATGK